MGWAEENGHFNGAQSFPALVGFGAFDVEFEVEGAARKNGGKREGQDKVVVVCSIVEVCAKTGEGIRVTGLELGWEVLDLDGLSG